MSIGSDCYPYTIKTVERNGHTITARKDEICVVRDDKTGERHTFYRENPLAKIEKFTLRGDGSYRGTGGNHLILTVGEREHHFCREF